ncbi:hypothetical protein [uncultured Tenacibaculum sp.]|uniref:hypothetical protein n=1 Tax=uncultured Tenacibaculum sp. TaxID=174713 RepID=UPI00261C5106|nr:hypothetical protein [uncultured Tenacibaculum sp.]
MKKLELNQMENLQGALGCGSLFGLATAGAIGGLLLAASGPIGWGAALYLASGASIWGTGVFCED